MVAAELGRPLHELVVGVHLGPPRANRKPVLAVADRHGTLLAFAKCGVDPLTDRLVAHEAAALRHLAVVAEREARAVHRADADRVRPLRGTRVRDPESGAHKRHPHVSPPVGGRRLSSTRSVTSRASTRNRPSESRLSPVPLST